MKIIDTRSSYVRSARADIKGPDMRTLRATPVVLVPAQGIGTFIEFIDGFCSFAYVTGATDYSDSSDDMYIATWDGSSGYRWSQAIDASSVIIGSDSDVFYITSNPATFRAYATSNLENNPLVIYNAGDNEYTGNDENLSIFTVEVFYRVHHINGTRANDLG